MLKSNYDHKKIEEKWRKFWSEEGVYRFQRNKKNPVYIVDTPPPYVSAEHLHAGHIMSYTQAEFVVRFKRMRGFDVYYPMGFDDNGLPTERFVEKKYDVDKSSIEKSEFVKLCLEETEKGSRNYRDLWTKLGISVDWSKTYSTINPLCQEVSQWSFVDLFKKEAVYRKKNPVYWCPFCQTALAQADMEVEEREKPLNYIDFEVEGEPKTIATTRPELIPACVALFAHPEDARYEELKGKKARVPLFNYQVPLYFDDSVDPEFGTGLVMVCSWGDTEDVEKLRRFNVEPRGVLTKDGKLNSKAGEYEGMGIKEARREIMEELENQGLLRGREPLSQSIKVHERCSTPVEFISEPQWFVKILPIKEELLERGEELEWYPERMKQIYENWVEGLKWDWCISRQRYYGVPFPVWYCADCGEVIVQKENLPLNPTEDSPPLEVCPECGGSDFEPEADVMDTWATSSCTPFIIPRLVEDEKVRENLFPNTLRPQAFEIIRTWLFYSVVKSHYHFDQVPFRDVMISGHGLDEEGVKISKRLGNYIPPDKLLSEYGADAIRYWAAGASLGTNHRFQKEEVKKGKYVVNKIWNAARFGSMNLEDYEPRVLDREELEIEDRWILNEFNRTLEEITENFQNYEYAKARRNMDDLFWKRFCDYYLEIIKHRSGQESAKYTLYHFLLGAVRIYAPILPFVTEEIYHQMFEEFAGRKSVHLCSWPERFEEGRLSEEERKSFRDFIEEIDEIRKVKSKRGVAMSEPLEDYPPRTEVDLDLFGDKLREMLNVTFDNDSS